jgi:hypothetical protein
MIDPNASDWSDLDLLTVAEARERLSDEIASLKAKLAAGDDSDKLRPRLAVLERRLQQ